MISSKTLPESDGPEAFESILRIGHGFFRNGVQQEFLSMSLLDERHQKTRWIRRLRGV